MSPTDESWTEMFKNVKPKVEGHSCPAPDGSGLAISVQGSSSQTHHELVAKALGWELLHVRLLFVSDNRPFI